jgi:hypothetical protein
LELAVIDLESLSHILGNKKFEESLAGKEFSAQELLGAVAGTQRNLPKWTPEVRAAAVKG